MRGCDVESRPISPTDALTGSLGTGLVAILVRCLPIWFALSGE